MGQGRAWIAESVGVAGLVVAAFLLGRSLRAHPAPPGSTASGSAPPVFETTAPSMREFRVRTRWFGRVESREKVGVVALVAGRVVSRKVEDGAAVAKGAPLFDLGGPEVDAERLRLRSSVSGIEKRLKAAKRIVDVRRQMLAKHLATDLEVANAEATVADLEAKLPLAKQAQEAFDLRTKISATAPGVFTDRRVSVGQDVTAGTVLGEILDPVHLRVVARLFPDEGGPSAGEAVEVRRPGGTVVAGKIVRILPESGPGGATVIWIEGKDLDRDFRPGRTVRGNLVIAVHRNALAVPRSAVVYDEKEQSFVFVQKGDDYEKRRVTTGVVDGDRIEIRTGITASDRVVAKGAYELLFRDFDRRFRAED